MDAVEFIKERNRMCKSFYNPEYGSCGDCPAKWYECDEMRVMIEDEPDKIVEIVEEWSVAHPCKTRQDMLLEQWPEAQLDSDKVISVCPKMLYGCCVCLNLDTNRNKNIPCYECRREFWSQEVE